MCVCVTVFLFFFCFYLLGNPSLGILKHKEKYYTFCSKEAAYSFAKNPDKYIKLIGDKAKESPELIQLLELHQQFESLAPYTQVVITFILWGNFYITVCQVP